MSEARVVVVRIPGDVCRDLAKNRQQGRHWGGIYSAKERYKGLTRMIWRQMDQDKFEGRVRLTFTLFRGRSLDADGATWALSALIDGLKGEAFVDDSTRFVELAPVRFVTGKAWAGVHACTEVKIESMNDGEEPGNAHEMADGGSAGTL